MGGRVPIESLDDHAVARGAAHLTREAWWRRTRTRGRPRPRRVTVPAPASPPAPAWARGVTVVRSCCQSSDFLLTVPPAVPVGRLGLACLLDRLGLLNRVGLLRPARTSGPGSDLLLDRVGLLDRIHLGTGAGARGGVPGSGGRRAGLPDNRRPWAPSRSRPAGRTTGHPTAFGSFTQSTGRVTDRPTRAPDGLRVLGTVHRRRHRRTRDTRPPSGPSHNRPAASPAHPDIRPPSGPSHSPPAASPAHPDTRPPSGPSHSPPAESQAHPDTRRLRVLRAASDRVTAACWGTRSTSGSWCS